jgi:integrase/recombinase XerD
MNEPTPLRSRIEAYLTSLAVERGLAANTLAAYRRDLAGYEEHLDGDAPSIGGIDSFLAQQMAAGRAPSTVARKLAAVRGFHRYLVVEGLAAEDPTMLAETPRQGMPLPKALVVEDAIRLVEAPPLDTPLGRRDRALLETLYGTGARVSEVVMLDLVDIDLETRSALVTGKGSKQRLVPLGRAAIKAITAYLPDRLELRREGFDPDRLFLNARGGGLTRQGVFAIVRKNATRAGIDAQRVSPHVLRHSAATHMVEGGADLRTVQEILGHASVSTTQVYTRMSLKHLHEVYVHAHPRALPPASKSEEAAHDLLGSKGRAGE